MQNAVIGFANPSAQLAAHRVDIENAVRAVFDGGVYIHGAAHDRFEREFADYLGVEHAVGVGSGTDALVLALLGFGIGHGDRVIAPSHTAAATISAIRRVGAVPVFVDVDPVSYLVTPQAVEAALSDGVKAVILVHLYGTPAEATTIRRLCDARGLVLIEDCAQATGAVHDGRRVGTIGHAGCFSFFPTKNLGALGDGGAVVTRDAAVAGRLRVLRTYGWNKERLCLVDGMNSRLDELQAAILSVKLPFLDRDNARRRAIAARYRDGLRDLALDPPGEPGNGTAVYHLYVVALDARDTLRDYLRSHGIAAGIHYPVPNHLHPAFKPFAKADLPATERLADRILSLPIYPQLGDDDIDRVIGAIRGFFAGKQGG